MKTQMTQSPLRAYPILLVLLSSLSKTAFAQEQRLDVNPSFIKCDDLLSKNTHAALIALGPPNVTWKAPYSVDDPGNHIIRWEYEGNDGRSSISGICPLNTRLPINAAIMRSPSTSAISSSLRIAAPAGNERDGILSVPSS